MRYTLLTSCAIAAIALGAGLAKAQGPAQVQGQGQTQAQSPGQTTEQGRPDASQRQREPSTGRQTLDERSNANAGHREGTERREERSERQPRAPNSSAAPRWQSNEVSTSDPIADSPEHAELRATVRRAIADVSPPERVAELDEAEVFDNELHRALASLDVLRLGLDVGDVRDQLVAIEELGAGPT